MKTLRITSILSSIAICFLLMSTISCKEKMSKKQSENTTTEKEATKENENVQHGGLALYTVRDAMGEDAKATLKSIAEIGYQNIEAAGYKDGTYYNMSPKDFKAYLEELNLAPISTHQSSVTLDNAAIEMAHAKAAGFEYFVAVSYTHLTLPTILLV